MLTMEIEDSLSHGAIFYSSMLESYIIFLIFSICTDLITWYLLIIEYSFENTRLEKIFKVAFSQSFREPKDLEKPYLNTWFILQ